jgi:hypothetical protein
VRFIFWNAEGSCKWNKAIGVGSKRIGSIGMKGSKVLTRRRITMFSIIIIELNEHYKSKYSMWSLKKYEWLATKSFKIIIIMSIQSLGS